MTGSTERVQRPRSMFGFRIVKAPDGTLHVLMPYRWHFSREDACGCGRCNKGPRPLGRGGYCIEPRTGRMLYGY